MTASARWPGRPAPGGPGPAQRGHGDVGDDGRRHQRSPVRAVDEQPVHAHDGGHGDEASAASLASSRWSLRLLIARPRGMPPRRDAAMARSQALAKGRRRVTRMTDTPEPGTSTAWRAPASTRTTATRPELLAQAGRRPQLVAGGLGHDHDQRALPPSALDQVEHGRRLAPPLEARPPPGAPAAPGRGCCPTRSRSRRRRWWPGGSGPAGRCWRSRCWRRPTPRPRTRRRRGWRGARRAAPWCGPARAAPAGAPAARRGGRWTASGCGAGRRPPRRAAGRRSRRPPGRASGAAGSRPWGRCRW